MSDYGFPVETIDLPSAGRLYPEGSPLRSGKVDVKYMTAKEEDILTSTNLIKKGTVIDKLMESLLVTKGVKPTDLVVGDLNAVMVASRILAYGKDCPVQIECKSCQRPFEYTVDLTELPMVPAGDTNENGEFSMTLPTGMNITFKILTRGDEKAIEAELEGMKKLNGQIDREVSTRLKYIITSVNGNSDRTFVRNFAESIIVRDIRALKDEIKKVAPDVNYSLTANCTHCGVQTEARMPFGANFFWPEFGT